MKKSFLILLTICLFSNAYSQRIKGTVFDDKTKSTIDFASVYMDGTFQGTNSDKNGNFELNISNRTSLPLVISAVGYYSVKLENYSLNKPILVYLTPKVYELNEVVVNAKNYTRKRKTNLNFFINEFLGRTRNSRECEITNLNDLTFNYNSDKDTLKAFASKPLVILNKALGYKIIYYLDKFEFYKQRNALYYQGTILFKEDLGTDSLRNQVFERKRRKAYLGSRMHFFRSLWTNEFKSEGFKVKNSSDVDLRMDEFMFQEKDGTKYIKYSHNLGICFNVPLPTSYLIFRSDRVYFDKNGYFEPSSVSWEGDMSFQRIADCLPYEYTLNSAPVGIDPATADSLNTIDKVYLHIAKHSYYAGDTIWYKAYLVDAKTNKFNAIDRILHVELYSRDGKIVSREKIQLRDGNGNGDFSLDEKLPGGTYYIKAYTEWMLNFENTFIFTRPIEITNLYAKSTNPEIKNDSAGQKIDIQFMPEGGTLLADVFSDVAFKATISNGKSCNVKGFLITSSNDTLCSVNSTHLGMGRFSFTPKQGMRYYFKGISGDANSFVASLPLAFASGYNLQVIDVNEDYFRIILRTNLTTLISKTNRTMYITCTTRKNICMAGKIPADTIINSVFISKKKFPEGITCITLLDNDLIARSERLFFVHKREPVRIITSGLKEIYGPNELASLSVQVLDSLNNPINAKLSMAVTQKNSRDQVEHGSNICSNFLLESDIKGQIEDPAYYFDTQNKDRFSSLDLLLLTQGWRNFIWNLIPDTLSRITYPMEKPMVISGKLREILRNRGINRAKISMVLLDSVNSSIIQYTNTDKEGRFHFDGISFMGLRKVIISACDEKNKRRGLLQLDSLTSTDLQNKITFVNESEKPSQNDLPIYENEIYPVETEIRSKPRNGFHNSDTIAIDQVVIHSKKSLMPDDGRYKPYGLPASVVDAKNIKGATDMYGLLLRAGFGTGIGVSGDCIKGLTISVGNCQTSILGASTRVAVLLNGLEISMDELCSVDPSIVESIDVLGRSGALVYGTGVCGLLNIITQRNSPLDRLPPSYTVIKEIQGFYEPRIFYSPTVSSKATQDWRTETIYWEPNITTGITGKTEISFYNKKEAGTIQASFEGLTEEGIPIICRSIFRVNK